MQRIVLVVLFLSTNCLSYTPCPNNCNGNGVCNNGTCNCRPLFSSYDCSDVWKNNNAWNITFLCYSIFVVLTQLSCIVYDSYQIYLTFCLNANYWTKWSVVTYMLILIWLGSFIRVIEFAIDPHTVRNIFPLVLEEFTFNIPFLLWVSAGFMLFLYWIELQQLSGIQELNNVTKLKPLLISEIIISAVLLLPVGIADWILGENFITGILYNLIASVMILSIIIISLAYGIKLMRVMKNIYRSTKISRFKIFFKKITYFLFSLDAALGLSILILVCYTIFGAQIVGSSLLFIGKKAPNTDDSTKGSTKEIKGKTIGSAFQIHAFDSEELSENKDATPEIRDDQSLERT